MEYLTVIAAILLVDLIALVSPGPNFVLITSTAVSRSRPEAIWMSFGIALGSLAWAGAAAAGITAVFEVFPTLGLALKVVGVSYLVYLGIRLLCSQGLSTSTVEPLRTRSRWRAFATGLLVNLTNPKSAAYYSSVFAAFLTPEIPVWVLLVLVVSISLMSLTWHCCAATVLSDHRARSRYAAVSKYVDRACGGFLLAMAAKLAWDSK